MDQEKDFYYYYSLLHARTLLTTRKEKERGAPGTSHRIISIFLLIRHFGPREEQGREDTNGEGEHGLYSTLTLFYFFLIELLFLSRTLPPTPFLH